MSLKSWPLVLLALARGGVAGAGAPETPTQK